MANLDQAPDRVMDLETTSVEMASRLKANGEAVIVSINGRTGLPIRDETSFRQLVQLIDRLETVEMLGGRLRDLEEGKPLLSEEEAKESVRRKYGISL